MCCACERGTETTRAIKIIVSFMAEGDKHNVKAGLRTFSVYKIKDVGALSSLIAENEVCVRGGCLNIPFLSRATDCENIFLFLCNLLSRLSRRSR